MIFKFNFNMNSAASARAALARLRAALAAAACALALAGCSTAIPLPALVSHDDVTGSIKKFSAPLSPSLNADDLSRALAALGEALDPEGEGGRVGWSNPKSGRHGAFVAHGEVFPRDEKVCRAFRGEIGVREKVEGTGCRDKMGRWAVLDAKPAGRG